jgi:hypothetical protein
VSSYEKLEHRVSEESCNKIVSHQFCDDNIDEKCRNGILHHKNVIHNDEWRIKAKTTLDIELFETHLIDFGSNG